MSIGKCVKRPFTLWMHGLQEVVGERGKVVSEEEACVSAAELRPRRDQLAILRPTSPPPRLHRSRADSNTD